MQVTAAGTAAFAVLALSGCGEDPKPDHQAVCVDQQTQKRIDDDKCDDDHHGHGFIYYPIGHAYPPVGSQVSGGITKLPKGHYAQVGGISKSGGVVTRGGFGRGHSGTVGG
jgi:hypothetical protein